MKTEPEPIRILLGGPLDGEVSFTPIEDWFLEEDRLIGWQRIVIDEFVENWSVLLFQGGHVYLMKKYINDGIGNRYHYVEGDEATQLLLTTERGTKPSKFATGCQSSEPQV